LLTTDVIDLQLTAWDYDNDGDLDIFFGNKTCAVGLFENVGTVDNPNLTLKYSGNRADATKIFDGIGYPHTNSAVVFQDFDGDGDKDCVLSTVYGEFLYYRNRDINLNEGGSDYTLDGWSQGDFVEVAGGGTGVDFIETKPCSLPTMDTWDYDNDGDYDIFLGSDNGTVIVLKNIGTPENPVFSDTERIYNYADLRFDSLKTYGVRSSICLVDFDGDGWKDIVLGGNGGGVKIYINNEADDNVAPPAPSTFTATALTHEKIKLEWSRVVDNDGTGVAYYKIVRYLSGSSLPDGDPIILSVPCPLYYYDTGLTQETDYTYEISVVDRAGNESSVITATAATGVPPYLHHFNFTIPSTIQNNTFSVTIKAIDNYDEIFTDFNDAVDLTVSTGSISPTSVNLINGVATATLTFSQDNPSGEIIIKLTATSGSVSSESGEVHLDIIPPQTPNLLTPITVDEHTVQLVWENASDTGGSDAYYIDVYRDGEKVGVVTGGDNNITYNDYGLSAETTYTYKLRARDSAGNYSEYSNEQTVTTPAPTVDETPPTKPTNLYSMSITTNSISFAWTASTDSGGSGLAGYIVYLGMEEVAFAETNQYYLTGLQPGTKYAIYLRARDNSGNVSELSDKLEFTTDKEVSDEAPPSVPADFRGEVVDYTIVNLYWTASTDTGGSGLAGYKIYRNDKGDNIPYATVSSTSTRYVDENCNASTTYTYKIKAYDFAGNYSQFSDEVTVTTKDPNADTEAPSIPGNIQGVSYDPNSVILSWDESIDNVGVTGYNIYVVTDCESTPFGLSCTFEKKATVNGTSYTITGLTPATEYEFAITAFDTAGNESDKGASFAHVTVTTLSITNDDTAPNPPAHISFGEVKSNKVIIVFDVATDNNNSDGSPGSGVKQYRIYRDNIEVGIVTVTTYEDTAVSVGETYSYYVKSEDYKGNLSVPSDTVTVTIPDNDDTPPTTPSDVKGVATPDSVTLTWGISSDEGSGVNYYEIYRTVLSTPFKVAKTIEPIATTPFTTYTDTNVTVGVEYQYKIRAIDVAGNASSFAFYNVTIPDEGDEDLTLYFPHIASDSQWWTGFTIVNLSQMQANIRLKFYDATGEEVAVLDNYTELAPGMKMVTTVNNLFNGEAPEGLAWLKVESDQKIAGFELFGTNDGKEMVGVKISSVETSKLLFPSIEVSEDMWTGIAVINLGETVGSVVLKAYNSNGDLLATSSERELNPNGKIVDLVQNFFENSELPEGTAVVKAESDTRIIGFELFGYVSQEGLAGLSGVPLNDSSAYYKLYDTKSVAKAPDNAPQNLNYTVLNSSEVELQWDAPISGNPNIYKIYTAEVTSTPFGSDVNLLDELGSTSNFVYTVTGLTASTTYNFVVVADYDDSQALSDYVTVTTAASTTEEKFIYVIPRIEELVGGQTTVHMVNLTEDDAILSVELLQANGSSAEIQQLSLGNKGKTSFTIGTFFTDLDNANAVKIISDKELLVYEVFGKEGDKTSYDTLFAFSKGLEELNFTHIAPEVNQWDSNISIWNLSKLYENKVTFELYNSYGQLLLSTDKYIPAGGVLSGEIHDFIDDDSLLTQNCWLKIKGQFSINGYLSFGTKDGGVLGAVEAE